jgi:hypothetical protein
MGPVRLDGSHAQVELLGDLVVGVAESDQAQHLQLPLGEIVRGGGIRLRRQAGAELRLQVGPALRRHPDRLDQLLAGSLLEDVTEDTGLQGLARERGLVLHRQHDDLGPR